MSLSIIVVEDDPSLGEIFKQMLEVLTKTTVELLSDGQAAIDRLQEIVPDVVILDLQMPRVSGLDVLSYIRKQDRFAETKVVMVTADALRSQAAEGIADLILIKPVNYAELSRLVERLTQ